MSKEGEYKIHNSLYISKLDRPPKNIEIEEYSMILLSQGAIGQRYTVVGFINESNSQILLFFRPSFEEGVEDPNRDRFKKEDRVESRKDVTGIVHQALITMVLREYKDKGE